MQLEERPKKRGPGRPPTGKILVGFKLSPTVAKGLRKRAKANKRTLSDVAEEIFQAALQSSANGPKRGTRETEK